MLLWGVGCATQDTLLKVLIASVLPEGKRNLAFGVFYLGYGGGLAGGECGDGFAVGAFAGGAGGFRGVGAVGVGAAVSAGGEGGGVRQSGQRWSRWINQAVRG